MAKLNLREKILNTNDVQGEKVTVKEWDVEILVVGMTGKQRDDLLQKCMNQKTGLMDMGKMNTLLVLESCHDPETNEKIFEAADAELVAGKSAGALSKVIAVASRLSGLDEAALANTEKN